jgi:hypothetical protein
MQQLSIRKGVINKRQPDYGKVFSGKEGNDYEKREIYSTAGVGT